MNLQLLLPEYPAFRLRRDMQDIHTTFFKCVRWQFEETLDPINCPYHYFCESNYPGNYPAAVDVLVVVFVTGLYLATLVLMIIDILKRGRTVSGQSKRCLLPSGPICLPVILLILAKGHRINEVFPLSCIGPAILQLVHISALTFNYGANDADLKYVFLEASTISGILHASLYLDAILLPYYTGLDALVLSSFSGECATCVCRRETLVVGGRLVSYRGWSVTAFSVVAALLFRIVCRLSEANKWKFSAIKSLFESFGWILIVKDSIYLVLQSPLELAAFGGVFVLICLHALKRLCIKIIQWHAIHDKRETEN